MSKHHKEAVREHYGQWATIYGDPKDDGLFSWVRAREVRLVHELLDPTPGTTVLDAGCGNGVYAKTLFSQGYEVWAVDFAPEMVEQVRGKVTNALVGDVEELSLGRAFDRVLCVGVLEWVDSAKAAVDRLARHVAPGGRVVVLAPRTGPGGWIYLHQKRKRGLEPKLHSPGTMRRFGEAAGLVYAGHATPWVHNFVMAFRSPLRSGGPDARMPA